MRQTKWYRSKWFYYGVAIITVAIAYFLVRDTVNQTNLAKHLKQQNTELVKENKQKDKIIDSLIVQKTKIKVIRERVTTAAEEDLIKKLQKEIEELRRKEVVIDSITPEELNIYLNKILTK